MPDREVIPADQYLIAHTGGRRVALVIDEAKSVLTFSAPEITAGSEMDPGLTQIQGVAKLPDGVEMVMPGDNVQMEIELIQPIAMDQGLRFAIREGGRTVGSGVVTEVIE